MGAAVRNTVLGNVEVGGEMYQLAPFGVHGYEAIRLADRWSVGTLASASGWLWRLRSETPELMHAIMQEAMVEGLVPSPPSD